MKCPNCSSIEVKCWTSGHVLAENVVMFGMRMKRRKRSYKLEQDLFKRLQKRLTEFSAGKREKVSGLDAYSYGSKTKRYSPLDFGKLC